MEMCALRQAIILQVLIVGGDATGDPNDYSG